MSAIAVAALVLVSLVLAILIGGWLRRCLPASHLSTETRDTVKLAVGLIGTMAALVLGLLVSSVKGSYDAERTQVIQMAAKVSFLNRVLALYGPTAVEARGQFRLAVEDAIRRLWPDERSLPAELKPNLEAGNSVFFTIENLPARDELQQKIKTIAETNMIELAQQRTLLVAQSQAAISMPMLIILVSWLVLIFASFSLLAPPNKTALTALLVSSLAVSAAIFLILELDRPFDGLMRIPSEEMITALKQIPE